MFATDSWFEDTKTKIEKYRKNLSKSQMRKYELVQLPTMVTKDYLGKINKIVHHLRKQHKLIPAGTYTVLGNGTGVALGVAIGIASGNIGAGIGIGAGLGVGLGTTLEAKARKDGKII